MGAAAPLTPKKLKKDDINLKISAVVSSLSHEWDLQLVLPLPGDSPSKRINQTRSQKCVFMIKALTFKDAINSVLDDFRSQADILYSQWVHKPKGERGTVPERTRHKPHPVSDRERVELQSLFLDIANHEFAQFMTQERETPLSQRRILRSDEGNITAGRSASSAGLLIDDTPIPSKLLSSSGKPSLKRAAEAAHDESETIKRLSKIGSKSELDVVSCASFSTATGRERGTKLSHDSTTIMSINDSFISFAPSVFDTSVNRSGDLSDISTTQIAGSDDQIIEYHFDRSTKVSIIEKQHRSSEYGSSFDGDLAKVADSFDGVPDPLESASVGTEVDDDVYEDAVDILLEEDGAKIGEKEGNLRNSLKGIFPVMPDCLLSTPLHVRYEIVRIFIHAGVSLDGLVLPDSLQWDNYDSLWAFLRRLPALQNRPFPERLCKDAWDACQNEFRRDTRGVAMSGSLRYSDSTSPGPLFRFQLEPLRLEQTYRLRRRFGNDRFLELDIPNLTGRRIPEILKQCPNGKSIVIEWLFQDMHPIFGRFWVPFCTRPKDVKDRKVGAIEQQSDIDNRVAHRIYFFAVHGIGFEENHKTPKESETVETRTAMSVESLLNWIRPTWENKDQSYLKLFARTSLALSRNTPTVVLNRSQIRYKRDLKFSNEIMTDGAGRLSSALALKIVSILRLTHLPSGFQGRIGDAKGFWSIDPRYHGEEEWIEIYDSQRKWKRSGKTLDDCDFKDPAHRIFEINKWSGELKSADLNHQLLPILVDRARSKFVMNNAIEQLLKNDLLERIESQRSAMESPLAYRNLIREVNSRLGDRVRQGVVRFVAGMPESIEEKMGILLDSGFHPLKLGFLNSLCQKDYNKKCEELKKQLHITVPRSTYAFMVPDFAGVLEEDEIYIHISKSFVDKLSPMSGCPFQGIDVLVARSPAHFASDIQRVRAVVKEELLGLKDVVVFPTKGNPSLANKLSGGDYDGDLAWICWEPSIVENFVNAKVPRIPDLVKEGFILKDQTTYEELVKGETDPTTAFLRRSFEFNLEKSMLGICTVFKESLCYTQQRIDSKEVVYLCTLLSNLVDQTKQGYIFTEIQWGHFRKTLIKQAPRQPLYKSGDLDEKSKYIIDRLRFVANSTIDKILTDFHKSMTKVENWDPDLVKYFDLVQREALVHPEWLGILNSLKIEIGKLEAEWRRQFPQEGGKPDEPFSSAVTKYYERFQAIQPDRDTLLTRALLERWHQHPESSTWALLRASCAFAMYSKKSGSTFVWWMAGTQLCHLKAKGIGGMISVAPHMYAMLKPNRTYVKLRLGEETANQWGDEDTGEV